LPVAPNLLARRFDGWAPNQAWVADIPYLPTSEGGWYLAAIPDLGSRRIVGWSMSERIDAKLVCTALRSAYWQRRPPRGLMVHSERGVQYASGSHRGLAQGCGNGHVDEPACQCLGQRADGELFQDAESRANVAMPLRDASAGATGRG
jgi:transposase InsO family protein